MINKLPWFPVGTIVKVAAYMRRAVSSKSITDGSKGYWPTTQKIPFSRGPSTVLCLKSSPNNHCPHDNYPESSKRHSRGVAFGFTNQQARLMP